MKIGFDAKRLFCNATGLGNYSRSLVQSLQHQFPHADYYLYTPKIKQTPGTAPFLEEGKYRVFVPTTPFKSLWRSYSITRQLEKDGIDLYHGLSNELPLSLKRRGDSKRIVTIHDLIFKQYPQTYSAIDRTIYDWKSKSSCNQADAIVAISESTKRDIINFYNIDPGKIEVIYQACNPLFYTQSDPGESKHVVTRYGLPSSYLLYVGSIVPRKNLINLVKAYVFLPADLKIPLVIIGRGGKYKKEVEQQIRKTGVEKLMIWKPGISNNADLQAIYQAAAALVYPSFYEGFGLPVVEALLCKTPVITSFTSALKEAGGPHSLYVDPENPVMIADAIKKSLTDTNYRQMMREKGFGYAHENFSPDFLAGKMYQLYQKTVEKAEK